MEWRRLRRRFLFDNARSLAGALGSNRHQGMPNSDQIANAVTSFREAAIVKGSDGSQSPNRDHTLHATMTHAVAAFRTAGTAGTEALRSLAQDSSPEVRGWAAAELLSQGDAQMVPILEELAFQPGVLGFNARMVLQEHHAGRLGSPFGVAAP
jgi:hypothetical protein